jgi:hypothetical protein
MKDICSTRQKREREKERKMYFAKDNNEGIKKFIILAEMIKIAPVSKPT